jgi:GNAT superfamily N-acetyltransferase
VGEDFELRTYASADAPAVLELLAAAFGDWPGRRVAAHGHPEELFRWKHERNPHGASHIFLAEAGGRLIGMRAYMPWPLDVDGRRVDAVQTVDVATLPGRRGGGVSSELADHAVALLRQTNQFALGLPNDSSRSISSKIGWLDAGRLPVWVRVRRPLRVARRLGALRSAGRSLAVPSVEAPLAAGVLAAGDSVGELLHQPRTSGPHLETVRGVDLIRLS